MAIVVTRISGPYTIGDRFRTLCTVALDNSYVTNGYPLTRAQLGFAAGTDPEFHVEIDSANGYSAVYDYVNQKLLFYTTAGVQTANATDLSAITILRILASGKSRA